MSTDPAVQAATRALMNLPYTAGEHDQAVAAVEAARPIERESARKEAVTDMYAAGYITAEQAAALLRATVRTEPEGYRNANEAADNGNTRPVRTEPPDWYVNGEPEPVCDCVDCRAVDNVLPGHRRRAAVRTEPETPSPLDENLQDFWVSVPADCTCGWQHEPNGKPIPVDDSPEELESVERHWRWLQWLERHHPSTEAVSEPEQ